MLAQVLTRIVANIPLLKRMTERVGANILFHIEFSHQHCAAPVMWGNVRPWATMLGSNVLLWFEACMLYDIDVGGQDLS